MPETQKERLVVRCVSCQLNQYMTKDGLCRKKECKQPLSRPADDYPVRVIHPLDIEGKDPNHVAMQLALGQFLNGKPPF